MNALIGYNSFYHHECASVPHILADIQHHGVNLFAGKFYEVLTPQMTTVSYE